MRGLFARLLVAPILVVATFNFTPQANAAAQRTFVASFGVGTNTALNCALVNPCRAFSEAISVTSAGGEVIVLDSAGYGPVTITQSVSIIAPPGVYAGISVLSGDGVTVNTTGIDVVLNGLTITGLGGANGIRMIKGSTLRIENCTVSGFTSNGTAAINISAAAKVFISDTIAASSNVGIVLDGAATVSIAHVKATYNLRHGIAMVGPTEATTIASVDDSVASHNGSAGILVVGGGATAIGGFANCTTSACVRQMRVSNSVADGNAEGMASASGDPAWANLAVSGSAMSHNSLYGLLQAGGTLVSAQNNVLTDNPTPVSGVLTAGGIVF